MRRPGVLARRGVVSQSAAHGGMLAAVSDVDAVALLARMTVTPSVARQQAIETLIVGLKSLGVWTKFDALYVMAAHDGQAARRNWVADAYNLSAVNSPAFVADRGYSGDGSTSYLSTGFNVSSAAGRKFQQNDAHVGVWVGTELSAFARYDLGVGRAAINSRHTTNAMMVNLNGGSETVATADSSSVGYSVIARSAANAGLWRKNGAAFSGSFTTASQAVPNAVLLIGGFNSSTTGTITPSGLSARQIQIAHFGSNLTAAEIQSMHTLFAAYRTAVGA